MRLRREEGRERREERNIFFLKKIVGKYSGIHSNHLSFLLIIKIDERLSMLRVQRSSITEEMRMGGERAEKLKSPLRKRGVVGMDAGI